MNPLEPRPMTPDQVADLVERVRAKQAGPASVRPRDTLGRWLKNKRAVTP